MNKWWAIQNPEAQTFVLPWTISLTRKEAIESMERARRRPWRELEAEGFRAVKVLVKLGWEL